MLPSIIRVFLLLFITSCSSLTIYQGPTAIDHRYSRKQVKNDLRLKELGNFRSISWQGWDGDTISVVVEAYREKYFLGPPFVPFFGPLILTESYCDYGIRNGPSNTEISNCDRMWISAAILLAPGHSISINPCLAEWIGGKEVLYGAGMVRIHEITRYANFIPLPYRCDVTQKPMTWSNQTNLPSNILLMIRFQPGLRLEPGFNWTMRLPCRMNGVERIAEFRYHFGQWLTYIPLEKIN